MLDFFLIKRIPRNCSNGYTTNIFLWYHSDEEIKLVDVICFFSGINHRELHFCCHVKSPPFHNMIFFILSEKRGIPFYKRFSFLYISTNCDICSLSSNTLYILNFSINEKSTAIVLKNLNC